MWPELSYKAIKGSDERDCAQVLHQSKDGDHYEVWSRQTGQLDKVRSAVIKYLLHFIICCLLSAWPKKFRLSEAQRQTDLFVVFDQFPSEVYSKTEVLVESNMCGSGEISVKNRACLTLSVVLNLYLQLSLQVSSISSAPSTRFWILWKKEMVFIPSEVGSRRTYP